ncbi:hypothetical protein TNCV_2645591 [Trichonephila clavipes]|nr:hypothetical protein TNCV_2645591 [Trichonephila clavipes]
MNPGSVYSIKMAASVSSLHSSSSYSPITWCEVWGVNGYTSRPPLVRIHGTLNRVRNISGVLRPVALPFIRVLQNPTFKKDNARMLPILYGPSLIRKIFDC